MESLLGKIYREQEEIITKTIDSPEYKTALMNYKKLYNSFKTTLTAEQYDVLDELIDSHGKLQAVIEQHSFQQGVKLGVGLIVDSLL